MKRPSYPSALVFALVTVAAACGPTVEAPPPKTAPPAHAATSPKANAKPHVAPAIPPGIDDDALDKGASPCDDFYQFACGGWEKATAIPDDESSWYRSFNTLQKRNEEELRAILERYAKGEGGDEPNAKKLGDYYAACMDEAAIEKAGIAPLGPLLALVLGIRDDATFAKTLAALHLRGADGLFSYGDSQDFADATEVTALVEQSGLGLPDRDYYLVADADKKAILEKYEAHVGAMFKLLGDDAKSAAANAKTVLAVEHELAQAQLSRVDQRDPKKIYHPMPIAELKKLAPAMHWEAYFKAIGGPTTGPVNVAEPEFAKAVHELLQRKQWERLRAYLRWHVVHAAAPLLPARFVDENLRFRQALTGVKELPPRWKRCVRSTDRALGEALAQPFVKAALGAEGKATVEQMIAAIEATMQENLTVLGWMDEPTRKLALSKLVAVHNKIGYPDRFRSYEKVEIRRDGYLANAARAHAFEVARHLAKIGKPVDRNEWDISPPEVNAYYNPQLNEMVFPAGILRSPFFANERPAAANFGAIGMVMGHELTHGFDDEGRQFDARGNMKSWWTDGAGAEFERRAACVEKQYDGYAPIAGAHINGKLTLGENIADLGGLKLALFTLRRELAKKPVADLGTATRQFFIGFAQGWCAKIRDESLRLQLQTNTHSPARYRVIGPVGNLPEFAEAFACAEGSPMVRAKEQRCGVW